MKKIINFIKDGFSNNTGYYYYAKVYYNGPVPELGFMVCRGYRYFWIDFHINLTFTYDRTELNRFIKKFKFPMRWKQK